MGLSGAFELKGVPPGRYKIAIEQWDPTPMEDKLQGAFSVSGTKLVRELDGKAPLEFDLAQL